MSYDLLCRSGFMFHLKYIYIFGQRFSYGVCEVILDAGIEMVGQAGL